MKNLRDINVSDNKFVDLAWVDVTGNRLRTFKNGPFYDFLALQTLHLDTNREN